MRKPLALVAALALAAAIWAAPAASGADVLVAVEPGAEGASLVARAGGELVSEGLSLWKMDAAEARTLVPELERRGLLRYTAPDRRRAFQGFADARDPLLSQAWHLERIGALGLQPPGPGVPLAVIDSLIDRSYPEFRGRPSTSLVSGHTSCTGNDTPHATIVAAIGAAPENDMGTVGVYPAAELLSVNACSLADSDIIAAMDAATARGPGVITLPLGGPGYSRPLYEAVLRAVDRGSLVVAAAGNYFGSGDPVIYPARYPHVLTVGSLDREQRPSPFSSTGADVAAPGEEIPVLDPEHPAEALSVSGTSFATPIVAAAAAWIWTASGGLDATQVDALLRATARDVSRPGRDARTGAGLIDLAAAVGAAAPPPDPLEPNDDVSQVARGGVVRPKAPLRAGAGLTARLDPTDDPRDLYRVVVPAGRRLVVRAEGDAALRLALWRQSTKTVRRNAARDRIAAKSSNAGGAAVLSYRNRSGRKTTLYLELRPSGAPVQYDLVARVRP